ncbi:hypothetical protein, partial [Salmonella enterica]|uniref:hypothetical protein n=1 Tax=Salmonella enterica TaxID=28901 RepID=UPI003F1B91E5
AFKIITSHNPNHTFQKLKYNKNIIFQQQKQSQKPKKITYSEMEHKITYHSYPVRNPNTQNEKNIKK